MKRIVSMMLAVLLIGTFALFALGSGDDEKETADQGSGSAQNDQNANADSDRLGDYSLVIDSCRLAEDYEGKPVAIIKYIFTNVEDEDAASFTFAFNDTVFQNGVSLNGAYVLNDDANYSSDNQTKEIKKGASLEVEVAYELNDTTSDLEVEVSELISLDDKVIKKTFKLG